ncbi:molecular chaperone HtpG [bacterium]|nr:molecular chaperone HtpG [bacterium]
MTGSETVKQEFRAEVKQLLEILAHSLYQNRDVFVRELISNAADALYKIRFETVRGTDVFDPDLPFEIDIKLDKENKTFTITDTGIGMTKEDLVNNIGTIARSGTAHFMEELADEAKKDNSDLIGRFGVGFYSVFVAGTEVNITTRSAKKDESAWLWHSDGTGTYEITPLANAPRGTKIEVKLREDALEFAEKQRIESIIRKYSNFVSFPIKIDGKQINTVSAIWREPKSSLKAEDYEEFYKFQTNRQDKPITHLHLSSDAPIQFNALLFIPETNYEVMGLDNREHGVSLFVRRILIQTGSKELLPEYLRFLKGVVDTEDLPLNISRETLQENAVVMKIKSILVKRVLAHLKDMLANDREKYLKFWKEYSRILKESYTDYAHKDAVVELLLFNSSHFENAEELTSLSDYVVRMKEDQKSIYYLSAMNRDSLEQNPHLEIFRKKGIEVLYLFDPIDEFVMSGMMNFQDKSFVSADQADLKELDAIKTEETDTPETDENETLKKLDFENLCRRFKDVLGERVTDVKLSERLTESAAVLVNPDGTISSQMQKILSMAQNQSDIPKKNLEINAKHPLIKNLVKIYNKDVKDTHIQRAAEQLYYTALLQDGYMVEPFRIVNTMQELLKESSDWHLEKSADSDS